MSDEITSPSGSNVRGPAMASWIILGLACVAAAVPFFGFAAWLIAGPLLTISLILGIIVITRGGTGHGIVILLATFIAAPLFIFFAPFVSSFLGLAGTGAVLQQADQNARANARTSAPFVPPQPVQTATAPRKPDPAPINPVVPLPKDEFESAKQTLQAQSPKIFQLKSQSLVSEGPRGRLASSDKLDLAQRELVQRENYYREKVFAVIAKRTGKTPEQVAATFAEMAKRFGGSTPVAPASQP